MPEAIKVNCVMTYGERLLTIKSHDHLTKSLCEGTWQIKNIKPFFMRTTVVTKLFRIVTYCEKVAWLFNLVILWFWFFLIWFACLKMQTPKSSATSYFKIYENIVFYLLKFITTLYQFKNFSHRLSFLHLASYAQLIVWPKFIMLKTYWCIS